jgi:hypothetical protein
MLMVLWQSTFDGTAHLAGEQVCPIGAPEKAGDAAAQRA